MGKIILEFDSYEEKEEAQTALNAEDWKCAMWEFDQLLRNTERREVSIINPTTKATDLEVEVAEKLREIWRKILNKYDLTL
jgi:hypothetical protein